MVLKCFFSSHNDIFNGKKQEVVQFIFVGIRYN